MNIKQKRWFYGAFHNYICVKQAVIDQHPFQVARPSSITQGLQWVAVV